MKPELSPLASAFAAVKLVIRHTVRLELRRNSNHGTELVTSVIAKQYIEFSTLPPSRTAENYK